MPIHQIAQIWQTTGFGQRITPFLYDYQRNTLLLLTKFGTRAAHASARSICFGKVKDMLRGTPPQPAFERALTRAAVASAHAQLSICDLLFDLAGATLRQLTGLGADRQRLPKTDPNQCKNIIFDPQKTRHTQVCAQGSDDEIPRNGAVATCAAHRVLIATADSGRPSRRPLGSPLPDVNSKELKRRIPRVSDHAE